MNTESIVTISILIFLMITSIIGNCLTILVTVCKSNLRTITCLLICNLAVSDLLITCINLPIRICQYFGLDWASGGASQCKISVSLTIIVFTSSNANLFLITLDRFFGISFPLRYRGLMTRHKLIISVVISWTYSILVGTFPFMFIGDKHLSKNDRIVVCTFSTVLQPAYVLFIEFGTFFTPCFVMFGMYIVILCKIYASNNSRMRSETQIAELHTSTHHRKISRSAAVIKVIKREVMLVKGVCIILTMYSVLLMPIATIDVIDTISETPIVPLIAIKVTLVLAYANPTVNPPIYALTSGKYRKAFASFLCCSNVDVLANRVLRKDRKREKSGSSIRRSGKVKDINSINITIKTSRTNVE